MKIHLIFALLLPASLVQAELKAPLPVFLSKEELIQKRSKEVVDKATTLKTSTATDHFYTGRLYDTSSATFTFKYRNYDPQSACWTSCDPSGFPDGSNSLCYHPIPTSQIDYQGLYVQGVYSITSRTLTLGDTGNEFSDLHFSNLHSGDDKYENYTKTGGPIPVGTYAIFDRTGGIGGSPAFVLDPIDSSRYNDTWDAGGLDRDGVGFRIHITGLTEGCITMGSSDLDSMLSFINSTGKDTSTTHITSPGSPSYFDSYYMGTLTVVE